jgi:hypothetical protein
MGRTSADCCTDAQVLDFVINRPRLPHAAAVPSAPSALRTNSSGSGGDAAASPPAAAFGTAQTGAAGCPDAGHPAAGVELDPVVAKALRKQRLLQDKNRRAQARFRERQKVSSHVHPQQKCIERNKLATRRRQYPA